MGLEGDSPAALLLRTLTSCFARCRLAMQALTALHSGPWQEQRQQRGCELELVTLCVDGRPLTLAVWALGGRQDACLGPSFFQLANGVLLLYDAARCPMEALGYWASACCNGGGDSTPMAVLACCLQPGAQQVRHTVFEMHKFL